MNTKPQCNDIPDKLEIFSTENKSNDQLAELYIENYSNTEFISEPDVYNYLQKVHDFLVEYHDYDFDCMICGDDQNPENSYIRLWKNHISELINELFNAFLYGNLFSAAAMTRTLIECFVYYSILTKTGNEQLIHHWFICNVCCKMKDSDALHETIQKYCRINSLDFYEMWKIYAKDPSTKRWLRQVIPSGSLNFKVYCDYLGDAHINEDYKSACAFVHGQDIASKMIPFTFYDNICYRFEMMMRYVFRAIRTFPLNESLENKIADLEDELSVLSDKYCL